ncbi:hypothetical protein [Burkholderia phage BCSR5]|nr:hypothetical protein [Burkholderia phage BCSR5]
MKTLTVTKDTTAQEIFDFVAHHLLLQAWPAMSKDGQNCTFRGQGRACSVGCLIPNPMYSKLMEGQASDDLIHAARNFLDEHPDQRNAAEDNYGIGEARARYFVLLEPHQSLLSALLDAHDSYYEAFKSEATGWTAPDRATKAGKRTVRDFWLRRLAYVAQSYKLQYDMAKVEYYFNNVHPI